MSLNVHRPGVTPGDRADSGDRCHVAIGEIDHGAGRAGPGQAAIDRADSVRSPRISAEGRVVADPGARVTVGTEVLGTIITMPVP